MYPGCHALKSEVGPQILNIVLRQNDIQLKAYFNHLFHVLALFNGLWDMSEKLSQNCIRFYSSSLGSSKSDCLTIDLQRRLQVDLLGSEKIISMRNRIHFEIFYGSGSGTDPTNLKKLLLDVENHHFKTYVIENIICLKRNQN